MVLWSCANVVVGVAVQAGLEWVATEVVGVRSLLLVKGSRWSLNHLPNPWTMGKHVVVAVVVRNVCHLFLSFFFTSILIT